MYILGRPGALSLEVEVKKNNMSIIRQAKEMVPDVALLETTSFVGNDRKNFVKFDVFQESKVSA